MKAAAAAAFIVVHLACSTSY